MPLHSRITDEITLHIISLLLVTDAYFWNSSPYPILGCAVAQAVSSRLRDQVRSCEICARQSCTGAGFLQVLWISMPIIPPTAPHSSSSIIRGWYNSLNSDWRTTWTQFDTRRWKLKNAALSYAWNCRVLGFRGMFRQPLISNILVYDNEEANGACGSVVIVALCYKPDGRELKTQWGEWMFSVYLILPAALGPAVYSASNRNEYQKQKNISGK
jgi:hypothetical protein